MSFSPANYMLQKAYQKLHWNRAEIGKIMEKLEAAGIDPPDGEKLISFCNIYASYHDKFMQSYEARAISVAEFLNSELEKIIEFRREIVKEIEENKHRVEQAEFDEKEHLRALKLEEEEIQNYKLMREKLDREYQEWKTKQEEERKERERLFAIINKALDELFLELAQSNESHSFLFDGKHDISIGYSDIYENIESVTRDFFNFVIDEEEYIAQRQFIIKERISNKIDTIIHKRPHAEHTRLHALKEEEAENQATILARKIDSDMKKQPAYSRAKEAQRSLSENHGVTCVKRVKKEGSVVRKVVSEEKEEVSREKETVNKEKEAVNKEKEAANKEKEKASNIQIGIKKADVQSVGENLEKKEKEKNAEAQIIQAAAEEQIKQEDIDTQARKQHIQTITASLLKHIQPEEKKTVSTKADAGKILLQNSLFLIPHSGADKDLAKNDSVFNEVPRQPGAASARKKRF